jgi:heme/copper-type cytochrome/quinol oxidase subunit 2
MENLTVQVLQTRGRWLLILVLLTQSTFAQGTNAPEIDTNIWHDALFLFSICFFVAGFIFMLMVKVREEKKHQRHTRRLSPRH